MAQIFVAIWAGEFVSERGTAMAMEQFANFSDEVTEGRAMLGWERSGLKEVGP